jgi:hypothetical protein
MFRQRTADEGSDNGCNTKGSMQNTNKRPTFFEWQRSAYDGEGSGRDSCAGHPGDCASNYEHFTVHSRCTEQGAEFKQSEESEESNL